MKHCRIKNCTNNYYAKGYCQNHYSAFITRGGYKYHKCKVEGCNKILQSKSIYCSRHKERVEANLPTDLSVKFYAKREKNYQWKGGVSEYPNHYLMKKNRIVVLNKHPYCEKCGIKATEVHHRNGNKADHRIENLMPSCHRCNCKIRFTPLKNKNSEIYGINLKEMVRKFGHNYYFYLNLHKKEILKEFIAEKTTTNSIVSV